MPLGCCNAKQASFRHQAYKSTCQLCCNCAAYTDMHEPSQAEEAEAAAMV